MRNGLLYSSLLAAFLCGTQDLHAQTAGTTQTPVSLEREISHLILVQDPALDDVLARRIEYNKKAAFSPQGFRVLVYSGSQRQEAYNAQMRFRQAFPNMDAYLSYQFPNFKVMAGDFHSRDEATKAASDMKSLFPNEGLLVVPQKIDVSKLKQ